MVLYTRYIFDLRCKLYIINKDETRGIKRMAKVLFLIISGADPISNRKDGPVLHPCRWERCIREFGGKSDERKGEKG